VALPNDMPAQVSAVEEWLRNAVVPAYDAYKADPSREFLSQTCVSDWPNTTSGPPGSAERDPFHCLRAGSA
jgi:hypothetical protein